MGRHRQVAAAGEGNSTAHGVSGSTGGEHHAEPLPVLKKSSSYNTVDLDLRLAPPGTSNYDLKRQLRASPTLHWLLH